MKKISTFLIFLSLCLIPNLALANEAIINPDGTLARQEKKSFFDFFRKKKKISIPNIENKGYLGTLPDIEADFEYKKQALQTIPQRQYSRQEILDGILLDAPLDDSLFLDVIIKKDKNSDFKNDVLKIKKTLEKLKAYILTSESIQYFNAVVNTLDLQTKQLENKFSTTHYAQENCYLTISNTSYSAKLLGNLKFDANFYSRYTPVEGTAYSDENIKLETQKLLDLIDYTNFEIDLAK